MSATARQRLAPRMAIAAIIVAFAFSGPLFAEDSEKSPFCKGETDTCCSAHPGNCPAGLEPCVSFICARSSVECIENCTYTCCEPIPE